MKTKKPINLDALNLLFALVYLVATFIYVVGWFTLVFVGAALTLGAILVVFVDDEPITTLDLK